MTDTENPLLHPTTPPRFDLITPEHVVPAVRALLADLGADLDRLEASAAPTWDAVVEPITSMTDRLSLVWGTVGHLMGVRNSDALRTAQETVQPEVVAFSIRLGQSTPIYRALKGLESGEAWAALDDTQRRIVASLVRDAELSGVGLEGAAQARFSAIQTELAEVSTRFSNNVLDATKAWALELRRPEDVEGVPRSLLELAAQAARQAGDETATADAGPWRITLDAPSYVPFMQHGRRRDLRERLYRAFVTRASSGEHDNTPLLDRILRLRREQAALLGFASYAAMSLHSKMAPDVAAVERLLGELREASWDAALRDLDDLRALAREDGAAEADDLKNWDAAFWAERLRERRYAYSDEALRPYFPLPRVLDGLFALAGRLFDVRVRAADGEAPVWHPDVRFFRVEDAHGAPVAAFYLDPYSRPAEKRGGAWMDEVVGRGPGRLPIAHLVCNQVPPVGDRPSCMTFDEVHTLFHEFGHGLQHMLTAVERPLAAGIRNVEWDAVELPSQFMENWCYHRETLLGLSRHVDTGEPLPDELFEKLRRRAHVPRRLGHAAPALLRLPRSRAAPALEPRGRRVGLRRPASRRRAHHGAAAAARGSLPLRLHPHLRGRLRRRLLQLQVGGGALGRRVLRVRGGGARGSARRGGDGPALPRHRARAGRQPAPDGRLQGVPRPRAEHRGAAAAGGAVEAGHGRHGAPAPSIRYVAAISRWCVGLPSITSDDFARR